jgi:alpha-L-rhamnosidase
MQNRPLSLLFCLSLALLIGGCNRSASLKIDQLWCNNRIDPVGIEGNPVFRWTLKNSKNPSVPSYYEIRLRTAYNWQPATGNRQSSSNWQPATGNRQPSSNRQQSSLIWQSGKQPIPPQVWVSYTGQQLWPAMAYEWQVRVWDQEGNASAWSRKARFVTGLPDTKWSPARWIGYEALPDSLRLVPGVHGSGNHLGNLALQRPVIPQFRKEFAVDRKVAEAMLFVSGLGQYTLTLDGVAPDDRFLAPGWTHYAKSCLYNGYDVTSQLRKGSHVIGVTVGNGFFNINRERYRKLVTTWGNPMMRLCLVIRYDNGSEEFIYSDESWKTAPSPVTFTSIYGGEDYDFRKEQKDWNQPGFNDRQWKYAEAVNGPGGSMVCESDYPLRPMESFSPVKVTQLADSTWVYDFGQNASGIPGIRFAGITGQQLRLVPGELINDDGAINQRASGGPAYFDVTTDGAGSRSWKPQFTYYGFRYLGLSGAVPKGEPNPEGLPVAEEVVFHHTRNSSPSTGSFHCSNELFNRIHTLIDWSIRSNLASVTTDCPHREKLGWLEQTHLVGNSIAYLYDIRNLYSKIVDDMIESQLDNGLVPDIAPEFVPFAGGFRDSPEWGSSAVIIPWDLYEWYGDIGPMEKAWPMMNRYMKYLDSLSADGILTHGLGDWFDMGPGPMGEAQLTPRALTATAIWFYDLKLMSRMAGLLGKTDEGVALSVKADSVQAAFLRKFYDPESHVISTGSQTAYAMPLVVGLVPESDRLSVFQNLIRTVEKDRYVLTAGDVGYRYLVKALQEAGAHDVIWKMNCRDDVPGYGFQLRHGATALTESWAALREVSNNHMMLGHLMEWLYSGIGGIRQAPGSAGYRDLIIDPQPVGDLTSADVSHICIRGEIRVKWEKKGENVDLEVTIPVGSRAEISFGGKNLGTFGAGIHPFVIHRKS